MHLTDEQLNEYLDNETSERAQIELHLSSCDECAARLTALQALFSEIESLPELTLTRDLREASLWDAAQFTRQSNLPAQLPHWLTVTATLQAAFALIAISIAAPIIINFMPVIQTPSPADVFVQVQSQWMAWLDLFTFDPLPALPRMPALEIPSLVLILTLMGVTILWLLGNGLLLKKRSQ